MKVGISSRSAFVTLCSHELIIIQNVAPYPEEHAELIGVYNVQHYFQKIKSYKMLQTVLIWIKEATGIQSNLDI